MKIKIMIILVLAAAIFAAGFFTSKIAVTKAGSVTIAALEKKLELAEKLPTIEEMQQRLGCEVDGELGKKMQRAWEVAIFNTYAQPYMNQYSQFKGVKNANR